MKITNVFATTVFAALVAAPVMAEPPSYQALSFNRDQAAAPATVLKVVRTAGMDKYLPYHSRTAVIPVDTEIAAFEEAGDTVKSYTRPVRTDRIPSL